MAKESSQGQARGPQRGCLAGVEERSAPPLGAEKKGPSPGGATDIDRWESANRHRGPRGPRWILYRQLPGAARFALAPGYYLPRLRRCCSFLSGKASFAVGSPGCLDALIDTSRHEFTIRPPKGAEFQFELKQQHTAATGIEAKELAGLFK